MERILKISQAKPGAPARFFKLSGPSFSSRTVWLVPQRWVVEFFESENQSPFLARRLFFSQGVVLPLSGSAHPHPHPHLLDLFYDCRCKKMPRQRGPMVIGVQKGLVDVNYGATSAY